MFATKIKIFLSVILKSSNNLLKNEIKLLSLVNSRVAFLPSISYRFYSKTQSVNGFRKPFTISRKIQKLCNQKYLSNFPEVRCWKCHQPLKIKDFGCASCGTLQPLKENINFFKLFGISQVYNINLDELSQKFRNLQKIFHPDKFVNRPQELEISEEYSRIVNKAYEVLKDPLARGFYILEIQKIPIEEPSPTFNLGPEFLGYVMEKSEELDSITTEAELMKYKENNEKEINNRTAKISNAFRNCNFEDAKMNLFKLTYFFNLAKKAKLKESELNVNKFK